MTTPDMRKLAFRSNTAAANNPVVITFSAVAGHRWRLVAVNASYQLGTPVGGLTISGLLDDTLGSPTLTNDVDVDLNGEGLHTPNVSGLRSRPGTNLVVTLTAGGALAVGKLNVTAIREPENA